MLRSTDLSIAEIAAAMGFSDSNYFFYFFKKHAGVSPGVFRRQSRREGDGLPT
jgi:AraC-like DNA-binding protein